MIKQPTFNDLCDAYERATGLIPCGATADVLYAALYGPRISDGEWDRLPAEVRNMLDPGSVEPTDRLAQVQPRVVYPVYANKWEPELVSIHSSRQGAEAKLAHLVGPQCDDDDCFHDSTNDGHVFIGNPLEVQP